MAKWRSRTAGWVVTPLLVSTIVFGVVAAVVVVEIGSNQQHHQSIPRSSAAASALTSSAAPSEASQAVAQFVDFAHASADAGTAISVQYTTSTADAAERLLAGSPVSGAEAGAKVVVLVASGQFTDYMAYVPMGVADPTGTLLYQIVDAKTGEIEGDGLRVHPVDISTLGTVTRVP